MVMVNQSSYDRNQKCTTEWVQCIYSSNSNEERYIHNTLGKGLLSGKRYSFITQSVLVPLGALPSQKTNVFLNPIMRFGSDNVTIFRSEPVAFQKPFSVVRLGLPPLPCFLSLGTKKYHSLSPTFDKPIISCKKFIISII